MKNYTSESELKEALYKALKGMVEYWEWNIKDPNFEEYRRAKDALAGYVSEVQIQNPIIAENRLSANKDKAIALVKRVMCTCGIMIEPTEVQIIDALISAGYIGANPSNDKPIDEEVSILTDNLIGVEAVLAKDFKETEGCDNDSKRIGFHQGFKSGAKFARDYINNKTK